MASRSVTALVLTVASVVLFLAGFVFLAFYVTSVTGPHLRYLGAGFLAACAAFVVGCLVGLIVGIPRFVSSGALRHAVEANVARTPPVTLARQVVVETAPAAPAARAPQATAPPAQTVPQATASQATPGAAAQAQTARQAQTAMAPMAPMTPMTLVASGSQPQSVRTTDPDGFPAITDPPAAVGGGAGAGAGQVSQLTPSTNLAEISDWLTKLLLGAGLVELTRLGHPLSSLVDAVARGLQGVPAGSAVSGTPVIVAASILVMYVVLGFLDGYVITTLWYGKYLQRLGYG
jgi:hypothetical protein